MASVDISFTMQNIAALGRRLAAVPAAIEREMVTGMTHAFVDGKQTAQRNARVDLGTNRDAIRAEVSHRPGVIVGRLRADAPHSGVRERGRLPGRKMPPKGVLLGWMARRSIPADREFPIRRAIGRRGIKGDHNIERTVQALGPVVRRELLAIGPREVRRAIHGL